MMNKTRACMTGLLCLAGSGSAFAAQPQPWEMTLQPAASPIMHQITWFEQYTLWFIVPIVLLVLALLVLVMVKFRESKNPTASRTSHNTAIEVVWTVAPVLILLFLAVPSFNLLTNQLTMPEEPDLTVKATATQWLWSYDYPEIEDGAISYASYLLTDEQRAEYGKEDRAVYPRLLAVDNEMVVPVGATVRLLVTAAPTDVIHSFAMPAFGLKIDAIPGRLNETWFKAEAEGIYYGQCSELCGKDHAFMPIAIRAVSPEQFTTWQASAATDVEAANRALMASIDNQEQGADAVMLADKN
ncbi:cytochrome c oxidase subunit II [Martelella mediterranea]|uniref:cytochrome c oxidase subunit II n=1 Tax=Martelella mediterranea TaxID=293089 RepID=UPI001E52F9B4|nr:cytochrome c oxidase subunit II [Martelella mediterranea]MCD1632797.1 cytochrome c oxidase subunit II [Martelella mediterranea]